MVDNGLWGLIVDRARSFTALWDVQYLFRESYRARGRVSYSPRFPNGDEAFDICLLEGFCLLVFEIKASILTVQAKYGFDPAKLKQKLDLKAINAGRTAHRARRPPKKLI